MNTFAVNTTNLGTIDWRDATYFYDHYCEPGEHDFSGLLPYNEGGDERVCVLCGYCNWWDKR